MKSFSSPKILLLYKISTYAYHFLQRNPGDSTLVRNMVRFKRTHFKHYQTLANVENFLKQRGVRYDRSQRGRQADFSKFDLVITVGGDGTFLEAARSCAHQAILGINSDPQWSVGRFCMANDKTFPGILKAVLDQKYKVKPLNRLKIQIKNRPERVNVLNDVLFCHANPAAMSRYLIRVNGKKEEQRSSGIWISTAAGSTGAIRSAGGNVLGFFSDRWQYLPRELYVRYHQRPRLKGGILSTQHSLGIISMMRNGVIYADGCHFKYTLRMGDEVLIKKSNEPLRMMTA